MSHHDAIITLDATTLDAITGGATGSDAQLTTALQGITSSLAKPNQNTSNSSLSAMLPMLLMLKGGRGGACRCGCGMSGCGR